jgi:DNA-binding NtrC family response regulator
MTTGHKMAGISKGETILVVDDDESVRHVVAVSLQSFGYRVLEASSGQEALDVSRRYEGRIELLVTDVVMPGMNGLELARQIMELRPEVRVIVMSGIVDNSIILNGAVHPTTPFFHTPFSLDELALKVREVLDLRGT